VRYINLELTQLKKGSPQISKDLPAWCPQKMEKITVSRAGVVMGSYLQPLGCSQVIVLLVELHSQVIAVQRGKMEGAK